MRTISERELCDDDGELIGAVVERGESFVLTRHGVPVARLVPLVASDLTCERPATTRPVYAAMQRVAASEPSADLLADLRQGR